MYSTVYGHKRVKEKLSRLVSRGDLTGSFLFYGPPSIGKRTTAFLTAKYALCLNQQEEDCTCESCRKFGSEHPDFMCVGQVDRIKVEDIDRILDFTSVMPFTSDRKVIVLDNAESMTWEAGNRLLKLLEEPPDAVSIFLVTTDQNRLLPTIISRCHDFQFKSLSVEDATNVLWKCLGFNLSEARVLGWIASESSVDVFSNAGLYLKHRNQAFDFVSIFKQRDIIETLDYVDKFDKTEIAVFVDMVILIMTDFLTLLYGLENIINADMRDEMSKACRGFTDKELLAMINVLSQTKKHAYLNINLSTSFKSHLIRSFALLQR